LALGSRLRRLSDRLMGSVAEVYRVTDLDFEPRWFPLYRLLADRGPATVGEAARELGLTHAAVSQTARAMAARGMIAGEKDSGDERRRVLSLTDDGRSLLPKLCDLWSDIEDSVSEMVAYSGLDILAAVEGLEQADDARRLCQRVADRRRARMRGDVEVVDYVPDLAPHFAALNIEWLEKYFSIEDVDRDVLGNPQQIIDAGGVILFARVDGRIVGTVALWPQADGAWELTKMAVTEGYQGRQIGRVLMDAVVGRARERGIERLFLVTNSKLTPAVSLYRKSGFRVTHSGPHAKYERGDLVMELDLDGRTTA
jgi:DNA-binding MarR family transcriptional regulator/GNAT superfamily N-acetyltransferase